MRISTEKCPCSVSCTPFSQSGKWWMSMRTMFSQHWHQSLCCACEKPGSILVCFCQSYRSALMTVASHMHISGDFSKKRFWIHERTASAMVIALRLCEGR